MNQVSRLNTILRDAGSLTEANLERKLGDAMAVAGCVPSPRVRWIFQIVRNGMGDIDQVIADRVEGPVQ